MNRTIRMPTKDRDNALGNFLKDRRSKIDPASLGYSMSRRRTPGLRREEVALRANVSTAWYTWLEQGRGGTPSADVLDRLAQGLGLSETEREHLFLLAQNRLPEVSAPEVETVNPALQHLLDSLESSPAALCTPAWGVLAANRAARVIHNYKGDESYNILESFFHRLEAGDWSDDPTRIDVAQVVVSQFRADAFRAGYGPRVQEVVEGLIGISPLFRRLWNEQEVDLQGQAVKTFALPGHGELKFEPTVLSVDGHPGLKLTILTPATTEDRAHVLCLMEESSIP
jgi:transcriptional regulator with XRE-family HTH domain